MSHAYDIAQQHSLIMEKGDDAIHAVSHTCGNSFKWLKMEKETKNMCKSKKAPLREGPKYNG